MQPRQQTDPAELYLDLLKKCLTRYVFGEGYRVAIPRRRTLKRAIIQPIRVLLGTINLELIRRVPFNPQIRADGHDHPAEAETMIGLHRLNNIQYCVADVLRRNVPGDLIETGAWRGGATIFMRGLLEAYGDPDRKVWVADSFEGLPKPDAEKYPADADDIHWTSERLAVSLEEVQANFDRYGLLDERVRFLKGWFKDTLRAAPIERLAVLRLDGDMYGSTMEALEALYPKLSLGGYVIVDDYGAVPQCKEAINDYRTAHGITDPMEWADWSGVFWQRT